MDEAGFLGGMAGRVKSALLTYMGHVCVHVDLVANFSAASGTRLGSGTVARVLRLGMLAWSFLNNVTTESCVEPLPYRIEQIAAGLTLAPETHLSTGPLPNSVQVPMITSHAALTTKPRQAKPIGGTSGFSRTPALSPIWQNKGESMAKSPDRLNQYSELDINM